MQPLFDHAILIDDLASPAIASKDTSAVQAKLSAAIFEALGSLRKGKTLRVGGTEQELQRFANAVAEIAFGDSVILRLHRNLSGAGKESVKTFADALVRVSGSVEENRLEAAIGKLAEVLLPDELEDARGVLAADNLALRDRFVQELPQLNSIDVGKQSGSSAKNSYATAARWKKNGEIISVQHRGSEFFPAFQFQDGRPHPTIKQVLAALPQSMTAWQKALWLVSSNGWLEDAAPIDLLDNADALVAAAKKEHEEVIG
ncbi:MULTISPECIES: hypothetical protein [unclassified Rhizobium]|uniref:hypothetical protein n=1 Tax=unclassified Rhizobium TaxID=2613769 RepID=UPI00104F5EF1|nr:MULTISPECIES: hypothetical protein [unclassified Rhizobium]MBB3394873.1 hypothetical protein [Rhizobium sp. BK060]MBB4167527.1 hypothetical protein [Rhizobium sp. BK538]TCM78470.1 hypothetical protein EV291_10592 [Rhizobium sp. BK068]